jgi:hypothetical protein
MATYNLDTLTGVGVTCSILHNVRTRSTQSSQTLQVKNPYLPKKYTYEWILERLSPTQRDEFVTFLIDNAAKEVTFTRTIKSCGESDLLQSWTGKVTTPSIDVEELRRRPCSMYTIKFTFEGVDNDNYPT